MYYVSKRMEISGAHFLKLGYESPCSRPHGHNWIVTVHCKAEHLNEDGMIIDFKEIKEKIHGKLDHQFINEVVPMNPTAENLAKWMCDQIPSCYKVEVWESEGNLAVYEVTADEG